MAEDVEGARGQENGARRIGPQIAGPTREDLEMIERTRAARDLFASKWKVELLYLLARGAQRYSRLYDNLRGASKKMLTDSLRGLERNGFVEHRARPPRRSAAAAGHAGAGHAFDGRPDPARAGAVKDGGGWLRLSIRDDGMGGADSSRGSGLVGLRDRVEALGGMIKVESPQGRGTRLQVAILVRSDSSAG